MISVIGPPPRQSVRDFELLRDKSTYSPHEDVRYKYQNLCVDSEECGAKLQQVQRGYSTPNYASLFP